MSLGDFWRQPCRPYRNFQIAFTVLTINFALPALGYTFAPQTAMDQFLAVNRLLGGSAYTFPEAGSHVWRYLAAANVMTLGFMCLLLQLDLRRYYAVLVPLVFMKSYAAACWWVGWLQSPDYRFFLAAAVLDSATCAAFLYFARSAHAALAGAREDQLVPRFLSARAAPRLAA